MSPKVGLVYSEDYLKHDTGNHPENSRRLEAILGYLKERQLLKDLVSILPRKAKEEEIECLHSPSYIQEIREVCRRGGGFLDPDTPVSRDSLGVALLAAGGVFSAIDRVVDDVDSAFCLIRPPGHHALKSKGMGFCIFNNMALGARYAQGRYGLKRVLIVDWDLHHGNGTQEAFYSDSSVLYFSIHQYPHYPGTGSLEEVGEGSGEGYTVNVPLSPNCGDEDYIYAFKEVLLPIANKFQPDITLLSCGFDAHRDDPLGGMNLTPLGYGILTSLVKGFSKKIVSCLEGGYNLKALSESALAHLDSLGEFNLFPKERIAEEASKDVKKIVEKVKKLHNKYWEFK